MRILAFALLAVLCLSGCNKYFWGGAAVAGVGAGAVYEHSNREALKDLEDDLEDGRIDRSEYERRKQEIEDRSVVY